MITPISQTDHDDVITYSRGPEWDAIIYCGADQFYCGIENSNVAQKELHTYLYSVKKRLKDNPSLISLIHC